MTSEAKSKWQRDARMSTDSVGVMSLCFVDLRVSRIMTCFWMKTCRVIICLMFFYSETSQHPAHAFDECSAKIRKNISPLCDAGEYAQYAHMNIL